MGGDYFWKILDNTDLRKKEKESRIIQSYKDRHGQYFTYVGSFPVMYKDDKSKYYLIFATSHFDGMKLMNDRMGDVFREFYSAGRLFEALPPDKSRDLDYLEDQIMDLLRIHQAINRHQIKEMLIPKLFLRYKESDYGKILTKLIKEKKIFSETGRTRINDWIKLSLKRF